MATGSAITAGPMDTLRGNVLFSINELIEHSEVWLISKSKSIDISHTYTGTHFVNNHMTFWYDTLTYALIFILYLNVVVFCSKIINLLEDPFKMLMEK
jgi:hypothetical protein